jgi:2-polyprenyl-6-methoxyphenol hydroxylase-like FAD-dependent oxidoreductase
MARILIAGASPTGMTSALFLVQRGIQSLLIEKDQFPRDKILSQRDGGTDSLYNQSKLVTIRLLMLSNIV